MSEVPRALPNPDRLHQWVMVATYSITDTETASRSIPEIRDRERLLMVDGPVCLNCREFVEVGRRPSPTCRMTWKIPATLRDDLAVALARGIEMIDGQ